MLNFYLWENIKYYYYTSSFQTYICSDFWGINIWQCVFNINCSKERKFNFTDNFTIVVKSGRMITVVSLLCTVVLLYFFFFFCLKKVILSCIYEDAALKELYDSKSFTYKNIRDLFWPLSVTVIYILLQK